MGKRSYYRVAKEYPPADAEYLTPQAQGRKVRPDLPEEIKRSWYALSGWDSEDEAR